METFYIAMVQHYWGKGLSIEEAKRQCRQAGGARGKDCAVYKLPEGARGVHVNMMGNICWSWDEGADKTKNVETVFKGKL